MLRAHRLLDDRSRPILRAKADRNTMYSCGSDVSCLDCAAGATRRAAALYQAAEAQAKLGPQAALRGQ